ncbi:unnamed protein product [Discula destructiva]
MLLEEQRYIAEDLERLEQGIADRMGEEPRQIRERLDRDHEVSQLLDQIQKQSAEMLSLYHDVNGLRSKEVLQIGSGDPFDEFYKQVNAVKEHHARYPNEQAENSETRYRPRKAGDAEPMPSLVDAMFSGEEAFGRYFDLHACHESYINLPNVKRLAYLQYLQIFDDFTPGYGGLKITDKLTDQYFKYVGELAEYLESFMRRTRPLENLDKVLATWDKEFDGTWEKDEVEGWKDESATADVDGEGKKLSSPDAVWCDACEKEFKNENVYKGHLNGRKHVKAAEALAQRQEGTAGAAGSKSAAHRLKERAVAEREFRVKRLASAMSTEREDTRVNVERRQGMTERERQQELDNLMNMPEQQTQVQDMGDNDDEDGEEKIYNPLKLPLAWDGKPIPFWLYRLHGLGVEFPCEICGNFVYMGRRAFEKHFNEARHIYGLKRLGINDTHLFRDITGINEALKLWDKRQRDRKRDKVDDGSIVQMEDAEGNVMPEKVYYDLQKQGLL